MSKVVSHYEVVTHGLLLSLAGEYVRINLGDSKLEGRLGIDGGSLLVGNVPLFYKTLSFYDIEAVDVLGPDISIDFDALDRGEVAVFPSRDFDAVAEVLDEIDDPDFDSRYAVSFFDHDDYDLPHRFIVYRKRDE